MGSGAKEMQMSDAQPQGKPSQAEGADPDDQNGEVLPPEGKPSQAEGEDGERTEG
jgi:hypothetical protein